MAIDWFPLTLSLRVAALSTLASLVIGLAVAYALANYRFRGRELLDAAVTLPLVLPPTVLGYFLLVVIGRKPSSDESMRASPDRRSCSPGRRPCWPHFSTPPHC